MVNLEGVMTSMGLSEEMLADCFMAAIKMTMKTGRYR
jgi:hypothetical protein